MFKYLSLRPTKSENDAEYFLTTMTDTIYNGALQFLDSCCSTHGSGKAVTSPDGTERDADDLERENNLDYVITSLMIGSKVRYSEFSKEAQARIRNDAMDIATKVLKEYGVSLEKHDLTIADRFDEDGHLKWDMELLGLFIDGMESLLRDKYGLHVCYPWFETRHSGREKICYKCRDKCVDCEVRNGRKFLKDFAYNKNQFECFKTQM